MAGQEEGRSSGEVQRGWPPIARSAALGIEAVAPARRRLHHKVLVDPQRLFYPANYHGFTLSMHPLAFPTK
jgi:hypothetical protein